MLFGRARVGWWLIAAMGMAQVGAAEPVGTAFNYQGELNELGAPANGTFDFQFDLYDVESGGIALTPAILLESIDVQDGRFQVELDFGFSPFSGNQLWLEIGVKKVDDPDMTALTPRQKLNPTPYAIRSAIADAVPAASITDQDIDPSSVQRRVTGSCAIGFVMTGVNEDGSVHCTESGIGSVCPVGATLECYSGESGTQGVGLCQSGTSECGADGVWSACEGETTPVPEICDDAVDNDCDGFPDFTDADCALSRAEYWAAEASNPDALGTECNDLSDNDGDGKADFLDSGCLSPCDISEDPLITGNRPTCLSGDNTCLETNPGCTSECLFDGDSGTGNDAECRPAPGSDCWGCFNGHHFLLGVECSPDPSCYSNGFSVCNDLAYPGCADSCSQFAEICDGIDNDCDGLIDEGC